MPKIRCVHCGRVFDFEEAQIKGGSLIENAPAASKLEHPTREIRCPRLECGRWMILRPKK